MNILEHYILEIYSERQYVYNNIGFVEVELKDNCHGSIRTTTKIFTLKEWYNAKINGYYMA